MKITAQELYQLYSPSPCDLRVSLRAKGEPEAPPSEYEQVLMVLGQRQEARHLESFPRVADLAGISRGERFERTKSLVASGTEVLYQPELTYSVTINGMACEVIGEPDFLIREKGGYVIRDVKLVRRVDSENHPEVILQLQFYGWLYEMVFGHGPIRLEVFTGQSTVVTIPGDAENVLRHLRKIVELKMLDTPGYSPVGWSKCSGCGFNNGCWTRAKRKKDVAIVYGVDQGLAIALHHAGIQKVDQLVERFNETTLASLQRPWGNSTHKVGRAAGAILRSAQALLANAETVLAAPAIPESEHVVMFDLEGLPPQLDDIGKVYLWGTQVFGNKQEEFKPAVAGFGEDGDEQGWHDFLRLVQAIFNRYGNIPFVHWAAYERTQLTEYVDRYGDRNGIAAQVIDNLLDLLPITRNSMVLPLYSHSLKEVEKYVGFKRSQVEFGGNWSMAKYIEAVETEDELLRARVMDEILLYNKEDLSATWAVFQWLRNKQTVALTAK